MTDTEQNEPQKNGSSAKTWFVRLALLVGAIAAGIALWVYFEYQTKHPSTDDAYIHADVVRIAPLISGQIVEVRPTSYQQVSANDLLVKIDPAPFQAELDSATAKLAAAEQTTGALGASITSAQAVVQQRQAAYNNAVTHADRVNKLVARGDLSQADADNANAARDQAKAALDSAKAEVQKAIAQLGESGNKNADVRQAMAQVEIAQLNLSYTEIRAPADGQLGEVSIRPGAYVQTGQNLFPMVESDTWYITANFKETAIERIKPGQPATISIDMYPGETWHGTVERLSPASGAAFALLPPENASGNWIKVTQRFPIRIKIQNNHSQAPLRIGASATVRIDTTSPPGPEADTASGAGADR